MTGVRLAMIVRDEADVIERCLTSALPLIESWCIVDTGSTDGTPGLIREVMADRPGRLHERPWRNFGANRTELLDLAFRGADWLLLLDADWTIAGEVPPLEADANYVRFDGPLDYALPLILRTGRPWRYRGVVHEYLDCTAPFSEGPAPGMVITDHGDGSSRADKLDRDLALLRDAHAKDPSDARTVFYLARTYEDRGDVTDAIDHYRMRAGMGGYEEERVYARYALGCLLSAHVGFAAGAPELLRAWTERPQRIEALRALANAANAVADKADYPTDDRLFIDRTAYAGDVPPTGRLGT